MKERKLTWTSRRAQRAAPRRVAHQQADRREHQHAQHQPAHAEGEEADAGRRGPARRGRAAQARRRQVQATPSARWFSSPSPDSGSAARPGRGAGAVVPESASAGALVRLDAHAIAAGAQAPAPGVERVRLVEEAGIDLRRLRVVDHHQHFRRTVGEQRGGLYHRRLGGGPAGSQRDVVAALAAHDGVESGDRVVHGQAELRGRHGLVARQVVQQLERALHVAMT